MTMVDSTVAGEPEEFVEIVEVIRIEIRAKVAQVSLRDDLAEYIIA